MDRFRAEILQGHKGAAVELPFDPAVRWSLAATALWPGRRGHVVRGRLAGRLFESAVVRRQRRHYVLVDAALLAAAGVAVGDTVEVSVEPLVPPKGKPRAALKPPRRTVRRAGRKSR
jgi:hypothetical protein